MANPHRHSSFRATPSAYCKLDCNNHRPANNDQFWAYDEVAAIFFEVVAEYAKRHTDFMTHEKMVAAFMEHAEGKRILDRPHDERSDQYRVGVMLAWFSRALHEGRSRMGKQA